MPNFPLIPSEPWNKNSTVSRLSFMHKRTNGKYQKKPNLNLGFSANQFHIQTAALTAARHFLLTNDKCHHCCCCENTILADQWGAAPLLLRYCCNMNFNKTCLTGPWRIRLQKVKACPCEHGTDGQMLFLTKNLSQLYIYLNCSTTHNLKNVQYVSF